MAMESRIFRFTFAGGIHIGEGSLEDCGMHLHADTFFSALCIESLRIGGESLLTSLVSITQNDGLLFSDTFPYIGEDYYLPKPVYRIQSDRENGEPGMKKAFKKLRFIPVQMMNDYFSGVFNADKAVFVTKKLSSLGDSAVFTRAAVRLPDDTLPYQVGVFTFRKGAGLYIIVKGNDEGLKMMRDLLEALSFAGIGGKRSSGLGRFSVEEVPVPEFLSVQLCGEHPVYMTLSVSLPEEDELEEALTESTYALIRRSGFVYSETYAEEALRKNDLYMFDSGSVVRNRFRGGVYDVSNKGAHPVYRYAKPMFLGVAL